MGNNMLADIFLDDIKTYSTRIAVMLGGLNEAAFLQQLHYWLQRSNNIQDGYAWVYNTAAQWQEQLPFLSERTIKRIIKSLREKGLIVVSSYNKKSFDRTNWYRIDYGRLEEMLSEMLAEEAKKHEKKAENKKEQIESDNLSLSESAKMTLSESANLTRPIPKNTTKITQENNSFVATSSQKSSEPPADVAPIPLNDGSEWLPTETLAKEYESLYPNVDVRQAFNAMRAWCMSNPSKRKTKSGVKRFVNRWLSKEQDSGRPKKTESKYREDQFDYLYS